MLSRLEQFYGCWCIFYDSEAFKTDYFNFSPKNFMIEMIRGVELIVRQK